MRPDGGSSSVRMRMPPYAGYEHERTSVANTCEMPDQDAASELISVGVGIYYGPVAGGRWWIVTPNARRCRLVVTANGMVDIFVPLNGHRRFRASDTQISRVTKKTLFSGPKRLIRVVGPVGGRESEITVQVIDGSADRLWEVLREAGSRSA
jgi:hypothetical protein